MSGDGDRNGGVITIKIGNELVLRVPGDVSAELAAAVARTTRVGMIVAGQRLSILIATRPVDYCCGHNALALIVKTGLNLNPHSGVTVVFRSNRGDRLNILVWDSSGLVQV